MAKFIVYESRHYIIEADSLDDAYDKWFDMPLDDSLLHEVEGGGLEIEEIS